MKSRTRQRNIILIFFYFNVRTRNELKKIYALKIFVLMTNYEDDILIALPLKAELEHELQRAKT